MAGGWFLDDYQQFYPHFIKNQAAAKKILPGARRDLPLPL